MSRLKKIIKHPNILFSYFAFKGHFKWINDEQYLKILYRSRTGQKLNFDNPLTFNEKLQWIKLYDRKPEYSTYVDKYAVRDYIKQSIGEEYLIPLIGVYNNVDEIPWNELPNKFVLKCTHGSGSNIICKDKRKLDIEESKRKLKRWMKKNWFFIGREWPYKNVKPRIICEEFISQSNKVPIDYKVMCFNEKAKLIEVHLNRFDTNHTQDFYDVNWNKTKISQGRSSSNIIIQEPVFLKEMLRLSELLAKDKYHVRVDWYEVSGKLYFGEITFFDASGFDLFDNPEDELMLGNWIDLDSNIHLNIKENNNE